MRVCAAQLSAGKNRCAKDNSIADASPQSKHLLAGALLEEVLGYSSANAADRDPAYFLCYRPLSFHKPPRVFLKSGAMTARTPQYSWSLMRDCSGGSISSNV